MRTAATERVYPANALHKTTPQVQENTMINEVKSCPDIPTTPITHIRLK